MWVYCAFQAEGCKRSLQVRCAEVLACLVRNGCPGALPGQAAFRALLFRSSSSHGEKDEFPSIVQEDADQGCVLKEVSRLYEYQLSHQVHETLLHTSYTPATLTT